MFTEEKINYATIGSAINQNSYECNTQIKLDMKSWNTLANCGFWQGFLEKKSPWSELGYRFYQLSKNTHDLGFLLSLIAHAGALRCLSLFGNGPYQNELLKKLKNGSISGTAITEPQSGTDINGCKTTLQHAGDKLILNGIKDHITNAPIADVMMVVCRSISHQMKFCVVLIDSNTLGLKKFPAEDLFGNRSSPTGRIEFNNVIINSTHLIGAPGDGLKILYKTIALDRALYGVIATGIMEQVLEECMKFINYRQSANQYISSYQYVQKRITDIKIKLETTRHLAFEALRKLDKDENDALLFCAMTKLVGTENLVNTLEHFMAVHGHDGYMKGLKTKLLADALGMRIAGGTSDIQRVTIFNQLQRIRGIK